MKKGVLLVNLGTPDSTSVADVRKYLREFLSDKRVIDIPAVPRWMLVNLIIAPFRAPKSAAEYRKLFTERGSPLKYYTEDLLDPLRALLGADYVVEYAMRYQSPSIQSGLDKLKAANVSSIHVIPMFPQYASATTGSVIDKVMEITKTWQIIPEIRFTSQFLEDDKFLEVIAKNGRRWMEKTDYDHFVFSYHGLPERQIKKGSVGNQCQLGACCNKFHERNQFCYRAQCFHTSRLVADKLGIPEDKYTVCFQSRLGKDPWIQPYTEDVLKELAKSGKKKVLAFSPAFVSDCLETTIEVGQEYKEEFIEAGGEQWDLVESLNDDPLWVESLAGLVRER
ncbi:ferrochelatase [Marinoscillum furvescens]|uniref:Ferrochelatase n=1 Tax=Marinoscillum furvescens DSM 4134 TaxID=1122208 RepID=A0A3D9L616_MARFU|nr:ferrochelatase [Marinoscillum furvescens]REE00418.1 ferrochelatase [Marinoscillum furvescens DSM 4134]